jgi:manganese/zinc/iron transport system substrate-binding protein
LMLEGKMQDSLTRLEKDKTKWPIAVTEHLDEKTLIEPSDSHGHPDPHVWMDVSVWKSAAETVEGALAQFDPKHAEEYRKRGEEYRNRLQALHDYGKRTISTIPHDQRVLITSHDAFSYFGRAYGLRVYGVQGISTDSEAGLQQINALVDQIVKKGVKAVFIESSVPRKNIEALVGGAKARGHEVTIGGELYSDAMGPAGTYEGTYEGMLDHNITTVTSGLGGRVPPGGMQGKLSTASGK